MNRVYLDYAAATPLDPLVRETMEPYFACAFANAHAVHTEAREAKRALEDARRAIAGCIHASPDEIIFTSGGTESNSLAILGSIGACMDLSGMHFATTTIEHPSVLDSFRALEKRGGSVSYIGVGQDGIVDLLALRRALRPETVLVSVMYANNEIGTIQPIQDIGRIIKEHRASLPARMTEVTGPTGSFWQVQSDGQPHPSPLAPPLFHTDASQVPLFVALDVRSLGVDMLSLDAQKLYGPKGVGALFQRRGVSLAPLFFGGHQERGLRPGTENVPGIVGFQKSFELAEARREKDNARLAELQAYFFKELQSCFPGCVINGSLEKRLPNNVNVSFPGVSGEFLVLALDARGVACSTRSACLSGGGEGSYVVAELDRARAGSSVRFTLGRHTTSGDIDRTISALKDALHDAQH